MRSQFGPKVVQPQTVLKAIPSLFEAKQVPVRDSTKKLVVSVIANEHAVQCGMLLSVIPIFLQVRGRRNPCFAGGACKLAGH
jgi:hypothetical protein